MLEAFQIKTRLAPTNQVLLTIFLFFCYNKLVGLVYVMSVLEYSEFFKKVIRVPGNLPWDCPNWIDRTPQWLEDLERQTFFGYDNRWWATFLNLLPELIQLIATFYGPSTHTKMFEMRKTGSLHDSPSISPNEWHMIFESPRVGTMQCCSLPDPRLDDYLLCLAISTINVEQAPGPWLIDYKNDNTRFQIGVIGIGSTVYLEHQPGKSCTIQTIYNSHETAVKRQCGCALEHDVSVQCIWSLMFDTTQYFPLCIECNIPDRLIIFTCPQWNHAYPDLRLEKQIRFSGTSEELAECRPFVRQWTSNDHWTRFGDPRSISPNSDTIFQFRKSNECSKAF